MWAFFLRFIWLLWSWAKFQIKPPAGLESLALERIAEATRKHDLALAAFDLELAATKPPPQRLMLAAPKAAVRQVFNPPKSSVYFPAIDYHAQIASEAYNRALQNSRSLPNMVQLANWNALHQPTFGTPVSYHPAEFPKALFRGVETALVANFTEQSEFEMKGFRERT